MIDLFHWSRKNIGIKKKRMFEPFRYWWAETNWKSDHNWQSKVVFDSIVSLTYIPSYRRTDQTETQYSPAGEYVLVYSVMWLTGEIVILLMLCWLHGRTFLYNSIYCSGRTFHFDKKKQKKQKNNIDLDLAFTWLYSETSILFALKCTSTNEWDFNTFEQFE